VNYKDVEMRLKNKVAIVTGGASGIGRATGELFAKEGARVVVTDIDAKGGQETVRRIRSAKGQAIFVRTDVSKEADVQNMVQAAVAAYGTVNILVNNAAAFVFGKVEEITDDDWQRAMGVNVVVPAYCVRHVLPVMKTAGGGTIVNIASVSSFIAQPAFVPYNSSKGALLQLTRCLALDLAPYSIRVNAICPGAVLTPATDRHIRFIKVDKRSFLKEVASGNYLKRIGQPREIAYGVLFLASDESSYVTGTYLVMDGGRPG
jgi:NAD(P)-dependent dehydrogenase (short-subunit alcohol dehydrogenase family)